MRRQVVVFVLGVVTAGFWSCGMAMGVMVTRLGIVRRSERPASFRIIALLWAFVVLLFLILPILRWRGILR